MDRHRRSGKNETRGPTTRRSGGAIVASSTARSRSLQSAARRNAIFDAALDEFSTRGFAAARLDDVAKRAGVAKGTIYLHFADKESLFQELIRFKMGPVVGTLETVFAADLPLRVMAEQALEIFVREIYSTQRKQVLRLIITEGPRFPALAEFYYREVLSRILAGVRVILRRARERGEIDDDALIRFPQLIGAPGIIAIVWSGLFDRFEPLDVRAMIEAQFNYLFGTRRPQ